MRKAKSMSLVYLLCVVLIGSCLGSALDFLWQGYQSLRSDESRRLMQGMIEGSEEFIEERYFRIYAELMGDQQAA